MVIELRLRTSFKRSSGAAGEIKFEDPIIGVLAVYDSEEAAKAAGAVGPFLEISEVDNEPGSA